jgi:hypothetical protein
MAGQDDKPSDAEAAQEGIEESQSIQGRITEWCAKDTAPLVYSNISEVTSTLEDTILTFGVRDTDKSERGHVVVRVAMSPSHVYRIREVLNKVVARYVDLAAQAGRVEIEERNGD